MNKKYIISCVSFLMLSLPLVFGKTVELEGEIDVDWINRLEVVIEVEGGERETINCDVVTNDNYRDSDVNLEAEVKYLGKRYDSDVQIDWLDGERFRIETESDDFLFDCGDVSDNNYNDFDEILTFNFYIEDDSSSLDDEQVTQIERIIQGYTNYTDSISACQTELTKKTLESENNYDKWLGCEEEGGTNKNELKHVLDDLEQKELDLQNKDIIVADKNIEINNKDNEINNFKNQLDNSEKTNQNLRNDISTLKNEKTELEKEKGNNLILGLVIGVVGMFVINRKEAVNTPEQQEEGFELE